MFPNVCVSQQCNPLGEHVNMTHKDDTGTHHMHNAATELTLGMTSNGVTGFPVSKYAVEKLWKSQLPVSASVGPACIHRHQQL